MKNKFLVAFIAFAFTILTPIAGACEETFFGIGTELFKDPFNNKIFITKVFPNTPAEEAGIEAGSEIVSVDGVKIKKMPCVCEVAEKIRGQEGEPIKLVIRKGWRWKTIELVRKKVTINMPDVNPLFDKYWKQVAPERFAYSEVLPEDVTKRFSIKYRRTILPVINYWFERKTTFERGFNTCAGYSKANQELCFINLLNRENETTISDKKIYEILRPKLK